MKDYEEIKEFLRKKGNKEPNVSEIEKIDKIISVSKNVFPDISDFEKENIRTNVMAKIETLNVHKNRFFGFLKWGSIGATLLIVLVLSIFTLKRRSSNSDGYYTYIVNTTIDDYFYSEVSDSIDDISDRDLIDYLNNNPDIVDYYKSL